MNRAQKIAWGYVIATLFAFVLSVVTVCFMYARLGMPKAVYGFAVMSLAALGGLASLFVKKDEGKVRFDERDASIKEKAAHAGFAAAFLFTCFACMIPFFVLGPKATVSVKWLPQIWIGTFVTQFFFYSLAILVQYGRTNRGEKS